MSKNNKKIPRGFTLIEVLIAIIILGIAMIAIYEAVQTGITVDIGLKAQISAHDVAMSVVSNLNAGILPVPEEATTGTEHVFNQDWQWQVKPIDKQSHFAVVEVTVSPKNDNSASDTMTTAVLLSQGAPQ